MLALQESIPFDLSKSCGAYMAIETIHYLAITLHAFGNNTKAKTTASECLQINQGHASSNCRFAPNFSQCFLCRRRASASGPTTLNHLANTSMTFIHTESIYPPYRRLPVLVPIGHSKLKRAVGLVVWRAQTPTRTASGE